MLKISTALLVLSSLLSILFFITSITTTTFISAATDEGENTNSIPIDLGTKIDTAKCRELGFASPGTSAPPACGTCEALAELLRATPAEKELPSEVRKENKAAKKRFLAECKECCIQGSFEEDAETTIQRGGVGMMMNGAAGGGGATGAPNVNSQPASGNFVSAMLEVDQTLAENTAHPINRFIRLYSNSWDKNKISVQHTESIPPRLHLKRPNGKIDIVNVGSWEPELIWEYLRKGLIA